MDSIIGVIIMYTELKYMKAFESEENENIRCKINDVVSFVPIDTGNTDYVEIMKQVDAGELTIEPADE
tara:strand:+ start:14 stop:217 length:204 start_codon:yes stop_codon:yes gene_type:complete